MLTIKINKFIISVKNVNVSWYITLLLLLYESLKLYITGKYFVTRPIQFEIYNEYTKYNCCPCCL